MCLALAGFGSVGCPSGAPARRRTPPPIPYPLRGAWPQLPPPAAARHIAAWRVFLRPPPLQGAVLLSEPLLMTHTLSRAGSAHLASAPFQGRHRKAGVGRARAPSRKRTRPRPAPPHSPPPRCASAAGGGAPARVARERAACAKPTSLLTGATAPRACDLASPPFRRAHAAQAPRLPGLRENARRGAWHWSSRATLD
ncbi:MAG: hypothetical protein J3K34DRAFT_424042 [Monoraphidium minutum]|nr:MAG: hypothetical protein J3K34DRAFT_424042 [Monoraphidium minutum]